MSLNDQPVQLAVIMPVYNEAENILNVLQSYVKELNQLGINFEIHAYNDGSKDKTEEMIYNFSQTHPEVILHSHKNCGHGPTILRGYRDNCQAEWIFQTDSDGEQLASDFKTLWSRRSNYDFLIGQRLGRPQPLIRKFISKISAYTIKVFYGYGICDVNAPFRLMRTKKIKALFLAIPENTLAPNIIISGYVNKNRINFLEIGTAFYPRTSGTSSLNRLKAIKFAVKSFVQTIMFRLCYMRNVPPMNP